MDGLSGLAGNIRGKMKGKMKRNTMRKIIDTFNGARRRRAISTSSRVEIVARFNLRGVIPLARARTGGTGRFLARRLDAFARKDHVWISTKSYRDKWLAYTSDTYKREMRNDRRCSASGASHCRSRMPRETKR